jgi:hypothetical protein
LAEGALVAEICNLIHANLPDTLTLLCEVQYSKLLRQGKKPAELKDRSRADLVIANKDSSTPERPVAKFIIEIKRAAAPSGQINADLKRLAVVRNLRPNTRTFLFVISEAQRPSRFVNEEGSSILGRKKIPNSNGHYRVRRTWKAAHAFEKRERAQYACLIEVYAG